MDWLVKGEAGTFPAEVKLLSSASNETSFIALKVRMPQPIHFIFRHKTTSHRYSSPGEVRSSRFRRESGFAKSKQRGGILRES
jgi:hypothetical protein